MKVDAVSSIGFRHSNYSFGEKQRVQDSAPVSKPSGVSDFAKVPVIVLLAMNPATLNSAIPVMPETDNPNNIVMLAPEQKSVDKNTYVIAPELQDIQQKKVPYPWGYLKGGIIYDASNVIVDGKYKRDLVFYTLTANSRKQNAVEHVFIIDPNAPGARMSIPHPPKVTKIIYHDLGKDKEFCSVKTKEFLVDDSGNTIGWANRELRIDDDSANKILALTLNKLEWKNGTDINFETTKTADMAKPIINYSGN